MNTLRPALLRLAPRQHASSLMAGSATRIAVVGAGQSLSSSFFAGGCTAAAPPRRGIHTEKRLEELGIELPAAPTPKANYNIVCHANGNMLYISGHLPVKTDGTLMTGRIGPKSGGESVEHGYAAARQCGLNIVATLKKQLGDLDRVEKVVKVFGIVQSTDGFKEQHLVMDGCSDLIMEVFGKDVGYHARSAIGTSTLPLDMSVEVEAIVQVKP